MTKNKTSDHQEEIDIFRFLKLIFQLIENIIKKTINLVFEVFTKWKTLTAISVIAFLLGLFYENKEEYQPKKEGNICLLYTSPSPRD